MKRVFLFCFSFFVSTLFFTFCDTNDPKPPTPKPPGYQEDIPWPSLADSPWPMFHGDPQSTGRSIYAGPTQGVIDKIIPAENNEAGIAIGYNSTIYFINENRFSTCDYQGITGWDTLIGLNISTTPIITKDSLAIFSSGTRAGLYAIDVNGEIVWFYHINELFQDINSSSMNIDKNGNLYFIVKKTLTVLNKNGQLLWELYDERFNGGPDEASAFSPDGKTLYTGGFSISLIAVDIESKSIKWTFGSSKLRSSPLVDNNGNIYFWPEPTPGIEDSFYSLKPDGSIRWKYKHKETGYFDNIESAMDNNGNIYFGLKYLYALDYEGNLLWEKDLSQEPIRNAIIVDNIGSIFFGVGESGNRKYVSYDKDGNKTWEVSFPQLRGFESSAALTEDGALVIPTFRDHAVYIVR